MRGQTPPVLAKIKEKAAVIAISAVTWEEALYGFYLLPRGKRREQIEDYLYRRVRPALPILDFDESAARWQAEQRARLRRAGKQPSYPDSLIAAVAAVNGLVLVTRNLRDFSDFEGLSTENWFDGDAFAS